MPPHAEGIFCSFGKAAFLTIHSEIVQLAALPTAGLEHAISRAYDQAIN